jgi:hypothetical protein
MMVIWVKMCIAYRVVEEYGTVLSNEIILSKSGNVTLVKPSVHQKSNQRPVRSVYYFVRVCRICSKPLWVITLAAVAKICQILQ